MSSPSQQPSSSLLHHASVGALSSVLAGLLLYPLDVLRTHSQMDKSRKEEKTLTVFQRIRVIYELGRRAKQAEQEKAGVGMQLLFGSPSGGTTAVKMSGGKEQKADENKREQRKKQLEQIFAGVKGFYSGLVPVLTTIGTSQFVYFYLFQWTKKVVAKLLVAYQASRRAGKSQQVALGLAAGDAAAAAAAAAKAEIQKVEEISAFQSFVASLVAGVLNMLLTEPLWKANMRCMLAARNSSVLMNDSAASSATTSKQTVASTSPISPLVTAKTPVMSPNKKNDKNVSTAEQEQTSNYAQHHHQLIMPSTAKMQNVFRVAYRMGEENGFLSLWDGLTTSLWLVSNPVLQYALYDVLKKRYLDYFNSGGPSSSPQIIKSTATISAFAAFLIGSITKTIATVLTYPLQVTQTRMRTLVSNDVTFFSCMQQILELEGFFKGFFKGLGPKLLQTVSQAAFMFAFYEFLLEKTRRAFH
ncbi:unnamed protein product [Amoebophrya sp. A120]|nr:unnamed protein product [Amoebophrya sp. A120]|eukprot:GSA120T00015559001.1